MKKNTLFAFLLCFIVSFIACDDNENEKTIPSRAFELPDGCLWDGDFEPEYIYIE